MSELTKETVVRRYLEAHVAHDWETLGALRHADWSEDWPQTGERVRGHDNERAIMDHWPGGLPEPLKIRVTGSEDRWVVTGLNTILRVMGSGDYWFADGTASYPDGSTWFVAAILELRGDKIHRETWYFAPPLEALAWRAQWVERIED